MKSTKQPVTRLDYCQYLLSSQINYTLTNFADHSTAFSHDKLNRYLAGDKITPRLVWENVKEQVVQCVNGYIQRSSLRSSRCGKMVRTRKATWQNRENQEFDCKIRLMTFF